MSQRRVEEEAGFSRGYLSLLLARKLEVKVWHLLAVLEVLETHPAELFSKIYPDGRKDPRVESRRAGDKKAVLLSGTAPSAAEIDEVLQRLYSLGADSLGTLRQRLVRCERAVAELGEPGDDRERSP